MLKRYCKNPAEWQVQTGKDAKRLAAHYRLNCDYRTAIMTCWEKGGVEPINLCEVHAKELGKRAGHRAGTEAAGGGLNGAAADAVAVGPAKIASAKVALGKVAPDAVAPASAKAVPAKVAFAKTEDAAAESRINAERAAGHGGALPPGAVAGANGDSLGATVAGVSGSAAVGPTNLASTTQSGVAGISGDAARVANDGVGEAVIGGDQTQTAPMIGVKAADPAVDAGSRLVRGVPAVKAESRVAVVKATSGVPGDAARGADDGVGEAVIGGDQTETAPMVAAKAVDGTADAASGLTRGAAAVKASSGTAGDLARKTASVKASSGAAKDAARLRARDLSFGDGTKALVAETIWNMSAGDYEAYRAALRQGKSIAEAAQAAGGQLAVVYRKIAEYSAKLEAALSESRATVSLAESIDKPLEQAVLEIIGEETSSGADKDAALQELGAIEEWVKQGLTARVTLKEAQRIVVAIGERLNWGGPAAISGELKAVYRALYANLKNAIRAAAPGSQEVQERLINLYAAKSELENPLTSAVAAQQVSEEITSPAR